MAEDSAEKGHAPKKASWWDCLHKHTEADLGPLMADLQAWTIPADRVTSVHDAAKASLSEVKALTEYEDGKVARLLTVAAFISAMVGAVFTRFSTAHEIPQFQQWRSHVLAVATYLVFILYTVLVSLAAAILVQAIRPRFNVPKTWTTTPNDQRPASMLFYSRIVEVTPRAWGAVFRELAPEPAPRRKFRGRGEAARAYRIVVVRRGGTRSDRWSSAQRGR
jgi:hypothetical protein